MLAEAPCIRSNLQAIDALDEVGQGIEGLSHIVLALGSADVASASALFVVARLLGYFGRTVEAAVVQLESGGIAGS